ncbi:S-Ena type endospore appendage [Priestia aryabhattai]|uniref:S-Ena type endospore appendage n=1 Tax=Priestia aryabhattai TaxID=412384 RepID=UPI0030C9CE07
MGKRAKKIYKQNSYNISHSCPRAQARHTTKPNMSDIVQNGLSGNILLNDSIKTLEIWTDKISRKSTVTISVFNSSISTSFMNVITTRFVKCPVEFTVPPGNTISATIENAKSIIISGESSNILEGKYCLEICFAASS